MAFDLFGSLIQTPVDSGLTWPSPVVSDGIVLAGPYAKLAGSGKYIVSPDALVTELPYGMDRPMQIVTHRFGEYAVRAQQRFFVGIGPRRFRFKKTYLTNAQRQTLWTFFEDMQGSFQSFRYNAPDAGMRSTAQYNVIFETQPLSVSELVTWCSTGFSFVERVYDPQSYDISATCLRFPDSTLTAALLSDVQQIIPLVKIQVRDVGIDPVYVSDRLTNVGGIEYQPRLLNIGEEGSDVIMSQDISGAADNIQFTFGNADRAMTKFSNATDLKYAVVELSLYHVQSKRLLQLWKGYVVDFQSDGSARFTVQCSDGLYQVNQLYPLRTMSKQCWKFYNDDGLGGRPNTGNCPFSTKGSLQTGFSSAGVQFNAQADSCDFFLDSANGCQAHGMAPLPEDTSTPDKAKGSFTILPTSTHRATDLGYFGGQSLATVPARIKDNSSGLFGFGRNTITATSIVSDSIWGQVLPEIWCDWDPLNTGNDPDGIDRRSLRAFIVQCLVAEVRDEGDFMDLLGIVGAGPIGRFAIDDPRLPPQGRDGNIVNTPDGYPVLIAPLADGFPAHGFKVDITKPSQLGDLTKDSDFGLRQVHGHDPAPPSEDLSGVGTPWSTAFTLGNVAPSQSSDSTLFNSYLLIPGRVPFFLAGQHSPATSGTVSVYGPQIAAGTSFVELRYRKSSHISPTSPDQHSMTVPIAQGLQGLYQNDATIKTITNPFWVAANCFFRALGYGNFSLDSRLASFNSIVVDSIYNGATGAGDIADLMVTPIVGDLSKQEIQFQFQGILASQKPFRDWLTEILACALGFYSFEFGKLKFGIRENAAATSAFTLGNMLLQSLVLTPIKGTFERLILEFADQAGQYQANTAEYYDRDHAVYFNRSNSPLTARQHSVGCPTISQAARLATTRVREEIGGINAWEWKNARLAQWKTTILALETEVGQVVSVSHQTDIPGVDATVSISGSSVSWSSGDKFMSYFVSGHPELSDLSLENKLALVDGTTVCEIGTVSDETSLTLTTANGYPLPAGGSGLSFKVITADFRIKRWTLHKDWSITIQGQTVVDSMYNLLVGPKPIDVSPLPLPILYYPQMLGEWAPYQVQAPEEDALFPLEWSFDIANLYATSADGTVLASITATGNLPINRFIPDCPPPNIKAGNIAISNTGGTLPDGVTLRVAVCASNTPNQDLSIWDTFFKFVMDTFSNVPGLGSPFFNFIQFCIDHVSGTPHPTTQQQIDFLVLNDPNFAIGSFNAAAKFSPPSDTVPIQIPDNNGANTSQFTLSGIIWPKVQGLTGWIAFVSTEDDLMCAVAAGGLTDNTGMGDYSPTSITVLGGPRSPFLPVTPLPRSTWALPNANVGSVKLKYKKVIHGGVLGASVFIATDNVITSADLYDPASADDWTGRVLMIIGRLNGSIPWLSYNITAYNPTVTDSLGNNVGVFTLSPDPGGIFGGGDPVFPASGAPTGGDTFVVCFKGYDNSANPKHLEDAGINNFVNRTNGATGLIDNYEKGYVARVIKGKSRGQASKVVGNGQTGWDLETPLVIDETSVWIIEEVSWQPTTETVLVQNATLDVPARLTIPVANIQGQQILIMGKTIDHTGHEPGDADAPIRLAYIYGSGALALDKPYTWGVWDSNTAARFLPVPVRNDSEPVDFVFQILDPPTTDVVVDITITSILTGATDVSIFPVGVIVTLPANSTGQVMGYSWLTKPPPMYRGDSLQFKLISGDGSGTFTAVLQARIKALPPPTPGSIVPIM